MSIKGYLVTRYGNSELVRFLVQLTPIGGAVDVALSSEFQRYLEDRATSFFDELARGEVSITYDVIKSEPFLNAYFSTYRAAINTRSRRKIRFFARLLTNGLKTNLLSIADEYEDYLKILEELSSREIYILFRLFEFENSVVRKEEENLLQRSSKFWEEFIETTCLALNISNSELAGLLTRLARTGCYTEITGTYWDYSGGQGHTTDVFSKLMNFIEVKGEDFADYRKIDL